MKRWFCLILAVLMIVPVLAIGAAAAEVYIFEYTELPAVYSDDYLFQWDNVFIFLGSVPPGIYTLKWNIDGVEGSWPDPVVLSFEMSFDLNGTAVRASLFEIADGQQWGAIKDFDDIVCYLILPFDYTGPFDTATASLTRIGDLPGSNDIGLLGFLDSVKTGFIEYSTANLGKVIIYGLVVSCSPVMAWFGYRFLKRKVTKSVFKGRF